MTRFIGIPPQALASCLAVATLLSSGCHRSSGDRQGATTKPTVKPADSAEVDDAPKSYEASADQLLAARLPEEQVSQGWIRLFDGHTLFGWEITGKANWRIEDGAIVVDNGEKCLLCTSMPWQDYELSLEFRADAETNSGVFLRTPLQPQDPAIECYEVNIAPDDNPFPTASVVKRQKVDESAAKQSFSDWRRMSMKLEGKTLQVSVDDKLVCQYTDPVELAAGRIGLQYNSGPVAFRDIRLRPIGLETLLDQDLTQWKKYPEMPGEFAITDEGSMHVKGGRAQIETKQSYDDFVLLCEYKLPDAEMNSGIFFRCIPGEEMMGYECQLSNAIKDNNPLSPADCGSGGIFRRQDARVVAGESGKWATVVLIARGPKIAAWVNGVQVSNWADQRPPDENPRKGLRLDAGTLMIQGHDPGTDALLRQIAIATINKPPVAE